MSKTVIKVEDLGKQYRLGQVGTGTISQDLNRWWYRVRGKEDPYLKLGETNDRTAKGGSDLVWALKDVNFEVQQGEVLGVIGKNGAGKSTLLKILSRVTSPTTGDVKVKGRIASLLEVGTGFHPDLTGRENIFLNGAILGMTKQEIRKNFDEIVEFSGVSRYIDTPVKRYSSGMYVRLAFAVAAHLESEILIIDEVLAVGDAEFQEKCLGKMKDVAGHGRTVLFVSHNMPSIKSLCDRVILMEKGTLAMNGETNEVIKHYYSNGVYSNEFGKIPEKYRRNQYNKDYLTIESIDLMNDKEDASTTIHYHQPITVEVAMNVEKTIEEGCFIVLLCNNDNDLISYSSSNDSLQKPFLRFEKGRMTVRTEIQQTLLPGTYNVSVCVLDKNGYPYDSIENFGKFNVIDLGLKNEHYKWTRSIGSVNFSSNVTILKP